MERKFKTVSLNIVELNEIGDSVEGVVELISDAPFEIYNEFTKQNETPELLTLKDDENEIKHLFYNNSLKRTFNFANISIGDYVKITYQGKDKKENKYHQYKVDLAY